MQSIVADLTTSSNCGSAFGKVGFAAFRWTMASIRRGLVDSLFHVKFQAVA